MSQRNVGLLAILAFALLLVASALIAPYLPALPHR